MTVRHLTVVAVLLTTVVSAVYSQGSKRSTTTTLAFEIGPAVTPTGVVAALTAKVSNGQSPISHGLVKFCDADAQRCEGMSIFGSVQLDSNGLAIIHLRLGPGEHRLKAVFSGTPHSAPPVAGSSSAVQTVVVKGAIGTAGTGDLP